MTSRVHQTAGARPLDLSVGGIQEAYRTGTLTAQELVGTLQERADGDGNCTFITVNPDAAADAAGAGTDLGLDGGASKRLAGVPVALKDNFATAGLRTTAGSVALGEWIPEHDAEIVAALRDSGAIIVGKANMDEFAYGPLGIGSQFGTPLNPVDPTRVAGGSSSGSAAAVAGGMCAIALGTDTAGSVRIPASFCGVVGFKPTIGTLSCTGVVPLSRTQDHVGILGKSVADVASVWSVLASATRQPRWAVRQDGRRATNADATAPLADVTLGVSEDFVHDIDNDVRVAFASSVQLLRELGAKIEDVSLGFLEESQAVGAVLVAAEASFYHTNALRRYGELYGEEVRSRLFAGYAIGGVDYVRATSARARLTGEFLAKMEGIDALLCPTTPIAAPRIDELVEDRQSHERARRSVMRFTRPFNVLGVPAISVPCGVDHDGLPIGVQIVGKPYGEHLVLRIGAAFEGRAVTAQ